jgi:hypothetical protein
LTGSKINLKFILYVLILSLIIVGCGGNNLGVSSTQTQIPTPTDTPTPTVTPTLTSTPLPPVGVLLAPPNADPQLAAEVQSRLSQWILEIGYRFQVLPKLSENDLERDKFRLVVALHPNPEIGTLIANHPEIQFLTIGIEGLAPGSNLSTIGSDGDRLDQQGFIAGYLAAMITPDWRVGVIGYSDSEDTLAARQAFYTGVKFYCGLCRPSYSPFYEYPLYFELGSNADTIAWRTSADFMIQRAVETVYVVPGAGDKEMLRYLANSGVKIIAGEPPLPDLSDKWVASLRYDLLDSFIDFWPLYTTDFGNNSFSVPLQIVDVNPDLLSPGKQRLLQATLDDVLNGYIDLGISPLVEP